MAGSQIGGDALAADSPARVMQQARGSRGACTANAGPTAYETGGRRLTRPAVGAGYAGLMDETYKKLFAFPRMVEDLLRGFAARGWAGKLEFSTLRKVAAEYVSDTLLKRHGDTVWQVRFRDGRHLLVVLEFQSREDPRMALRILVYTSLLYQELFRNEALVLDAKGRLPAVLPVVVYNGAAPWKAAGEVGELVQPVDGELVRYRPSQRYHVLDERHVGEEDLPHRNLVTAVVRLERIGTPTDLIRVVDRLREWLRSPADDDLRRAFTDWVRRIAERLMPGGGHLAAEMTLEDVRMTLVERVSEWPKQWVREGREQGMREGIERGVEQGIEQGIEQGRAEERALLRRMAASRFGADTAECLSGVLAGIADPERLAEVGEWLVRCETGEEFLVRVDTALGGGDRRGT